MLHLRETSMVIYDSHQILDPQDTGTPFVIPVESQRSALNPPRPALLSRIIRCHMSSSLGQFFWASFFGPWAHRLTSYQRYDPAVNPGRSDPRYLSSSCYCQCLGGRKPTGMMVRLRGIIHEWPHFSCVNYDHSASTSHPFRQKTPLVDFIWVRKLDTPEDLKGRLDERMWTMR